jgi:hypothetical protein
MTMAWRTWESPDRRQSTSRSRIAGVTSAAPGSTSNRSSNPGSPAGTRRRVNGNTALRTATRPWLPSSRRITVETSTGSASPGETRPKTRATR